MAANPFEILGFTPSFQIDIKALEDRYYDWTKKSHPDRFANADAVAKMKIQQAVAELNQAFIALKQPENRLEALLQLAGLIDDEKGSGERKLPSALAEEFFEIQEAAAGKTPGTKQKIELFRSRLLIKRDELTKQMYTLATDIDWTQASSSKKALDIVSLRRERAYVRSMLENLDRIERSLG